MLRKTEKYFKRNVQAWDRGHLTDEKSTVWILNETWWIFFIIPIYSRDTIKKTLEER